MCKLNPKIDLVFKKIFGTEQNKNVLKSLINSVLPKDEQIVEVTIKNPYNETDFIGDKLSVVDIKATDEKGRWYDIEIQVKEQKFYGKRAIFYLSEIYSNQLRESDSYDKLRKTIIISILDFDYFLNDKRYFRRCCYKDFDTNQLYPELDYADLYFVELRKFDNELKNIKTTLDRWITFLNKATEYDNENLPNELKDPEIIQAINTIETMSLNAKEREYYESEKKVMRDRDAVMQTAVDNAKIEIAIEMINDGETNEKITKYTKLTDEQINELRNKLNDK
jgi:predicted transposase/invertase (TIGR01784 family)